MKKSILFTIGTMDGGGVAQSLLSLLSVIDTTRYDVSLLMASTKGERTKSVPRNIRVLTDKRLDAVCGGVHGLGFLLAHFHLLLFFGSLLRLLLSLVNKGWAGWWLSRLMPTITKEAYDLVVDYNGQHMLYYMVDKLHAAHKASFFHSDYKRWAFYKSTDARYFLRVDAVFSISEACVASLKDVFPEVSERIHLMENIVNPDAIREKAEAPADIKPTCRHTLVTVGHVCLQKGCMLALETAKRLKEQGEDFEWWFVGSLSAEEDYPAAARRLGVKDKVRFLGAQKNPYAYMRLAEVIVHPSRFEGKSIALDEAKILCKPIVVTNFSTVHDQFENGINGSICEMTPEDVAEKIQELLHDDERKARYTAYLEAHIPDNRSEIQKIYRLVEGNELD